ncbi:MAG: dTDP-4-dehydrorhamnose 3,5-epimerase [Saprospiraceae bacterium]|nr:dTDP-4-dehydrorhamnose 3,5-epimerase [Saprospiraceae bacterium]
MNFQETDIKGLVIIEPDIWKDNRGYFYETFQQQRYVDSGIRCNFVQDNEAFSGKGVLRGLHYQLPPFGQAKLVRIIHGSVIDVAVDIRPESPTYGQYHAVLLSGENKKQFFIPQGFAHGYVCLSDEVIFSYKCSSFYSKEHEGGIRFDDPQLNIDWQLPAEQLIVSDRDLGLPSFGKHRQWPEK